MDYNRHPHALHIILSTVLLLSSAFIPQGCAGAGARPDIVGRINSIQQVLQAGSPGRILVDSPGNLTSDKFVLTVTNRTSIQKLVGEKSEPANFNELRVGQDIKVWLTGGIRESYPAQADASKIRIVRDIVVTFDQLFSSPSRYNNSEVVIEGFCFFGFEISVLCERLEYSGLVVGHLVPKGRILWISGGIPADVYEKLGLQQMMGPSERYGKIRITGWFEYGSRYGHLGGYDSQIVIAEAQLLEWEE